MNEQSIVRKLKTFGYYNEDAQSCVVNYIAKNDCDFDSISNAHQMKDFVVKAITSEFKFCVRGTTLADLFCNMTTSKVHLKRKQQMQDIMRGKRFF